MQAEKETAQRDSENPQWQNDTQRYPRRFKLMQTHVRRKTKQ
jgi:hypothetical protein